MRTTRVLAGALPLAAMLAVLGAASEPVLAQSLLQRMFGFGSSRPPPEPRYDPVDRYEPYSRPSYGYDGVWQEDFGSYRTVCVRLCDGFYFPIGDSVRRERLYQDNRACMRRCDGEARLFYYPTDGGSPETMVDLAGRSYRSLPNAFRYRKSLVEGCACKPAPWSEGEIARHQGYAAGAQSVAEAEETGQSRPARTAAGPSVEEPYYFEAPQPYVRPPEPQHYTRWRRPPWADPRYGWQD